MLGNWIRMTSTTASAVNLTLDSVTGYPNIATQFADNVRFSYSILDDSDGTPVECGIGYTTTSGTVLVRETVIATYVSSTYSEYPTAATAPTTARIIVTPLSNVFGDSMPQIADTTNGAYIRLPGFGTANNNTSCAADVVQITAGRINTSAKIYGMAYFLDTVTASGPNYCRMGIYSIKQDGTVGGLIAETAQDDTSVSAGVYHEAAFSGGAITLPAGYYALAFLSDTTVTIGGWGAFGGTTESSVFGIAVVSTNAQNCMARDNVTTGWSAMPSTLTYDSFVSHAATYPVILMLVTTTI